MSTNAGHLQLAKGVGRPHSRRLAGIEEGGGRLDGPAGIAGPFPETQATQPDPPGQGRRSIPDLVGRQFSAERIDQRWCGDLIEIPTEQGKLYLASVLDLASRRMAGFAMSEHHNAALARAALLSVAAVRGW